MKTDISKNYITIQGWMVSDLKLKANELLVFSLIYGFTQDGYNEFTGSIDYICNWLNSSRPTVAKALMDLCNKNLIIKRLETTNKGKFNRYKVNLLVVASKESLLGGSKESLLGGSKESLLGGSKESLLGGSKESLHNNNNLYNYNIDNNNNNIEPDFSKNDFSPNKEKIEKFDVEKYLIEQGISIELIKEFIQHRKNKKAPINKIVMNGIEREAKNAQISLEKALETIIERNWTGIKAEWLNGSKNNFGLPIPQPIKYNFLEANQPLT